MVIPCPSGPVPSKGINTFFRFYIRSEDCAVRVLLISLAYRIEPAKTSACLPKVTPTARGAILRKNEPMEIRVCPECDKAFYSPRVSDVVACSHCGFIMFDRRGSKRVHKEFDCRFLLDGQVVSARLQDYSADGLRMVYTGKALKADTVLDVEVEGLDVHRPARTVWSMKISRHSASAGLRLL